MLSTPFTFAALWADLARIAGEPVPGDVAAVLDTPRDLLPLAVPAFRQRNATLVYAD